MAIAAIGIGIAVSIKKSYSLVQKLPTPPVPTAPPIPPVQAAQAPINGIRRKKKMEKRKSDKKSISTFQLT